CFCTYFSDLQKIFKKSYETVDENTQSRQADVLGTVLKAVIKFQRRLQVKSTARTSPIPPEPQENEISSDEQIGLDNYFKEPHELITVLKDLEVANLSLIQNCQDAEDTIESLRKGEELLNKQSLKETEDVKTRMKQLEEIISQWNNDLSQDGMPEPDEGEAKQDKQFAELCEQIADVYNTCGLQKLYPISENEEAPLRALEQFARIDAHVAFLLTSVASSGASEERVEALRREVRAARREKLRQEQREAERAKQEERARRALLRARAPAPAKKVVVLQVIAS
uniref:DUF4200 domain-containing protein n=1 Tax=Mesocestoides corti TaxID=53468 RepID=A0A5K3EIB2_MESCO